MQGTYNTPAFINDQVYSQFILQNLHDGLLPETMTRVITDFPNGTTLNIKSIGTVTIQEAEEDVPLTATPIDSSTITMSIQNYIGDSWYVTQDLREDGAQVEQLMAARLMESTRAIQEVYETRFLATANAAQTNANANSFNGFAHRIASAESNNVGSVDHLIAMRLAFDKANVPQQGRILLVDPVLS